MGTIPRTMRLALSQVFERALRAALHTAGLFCPHFGEVACRRRRTRPRYDRPHDGPLPRVVCVSPAVYYIELRQAVPQTRSFCARMACIVSSSRSKLRPSPPPHTPHSRHVRALSLQRRTSRRAAPHPCASAPKMLAGQRSAGARAVRLGPPAFT